MPEKLKAKNFSVQLGDLLTNYFLKCRHIYRINKIVHIHMCSLIIGYSVEFSCTPWSKLEKLEIFIEYKCTLFRCFTTGCLLKEIFNITIKYCFLWPYVYFCLPGILLKSLYQKSIGNFNESNNAHTHTKR